MVCVFELLELVVVWGLDFLFVLFVFGGGGVLIIVVVVIGGFVLRVRDMVSVYCVDGFCSVEVEGFFVIDEVFLIMIDVFVVMGFVVVGLGIYLLVDVFFCGELIEVFVDVVIGLNGGVFFVRG